MTLVLGKLHDPADCVGSGDDFEANKRLTQLFYVVRLGQLAG